VSDAHRAAVPVPHRCVPVPQVKSQAVPLQVVALAPVGWGHDAQLLPHEFTLVLEAQMPLQLCVPDGQTPEQAAAVAMHVPEQIFMPEGHAG